MSVAGERGGMSGWLLHANALCAFVWSKPLRSVCDAVASGTARAGRAGEVGVGTSTLVIRANIHVEHRAAARFEFEASCESPHITWKLSLRCV